MKILVGLMVCVGLWGQANNNNPSMVLLGADGPGAVSGVGTTVVGNVGSNTLYYWVVPVYPIGQGKISQQVVVGNAPGVLSVTNYVRVSWNMNPTATGYYVLRTTTPTIPSTCTCKVTGPSNISTVNDQGGALTSFTYSPAGNAIATILLDNQNYAVPTLLATPPFGGGSGMIYPGAGVANSSGAAWGASYTVGTGNNNLVQLNGSSQLPAVSGALLTNLGNATTATALAANGTDCGASNFAAGVDASGNATGCAVPPGTYSLPTTTVAQKFFGTAAPGSVASNLPGDFFTDTTNHNEYVCNAPSGTAAPACTSVTAAGWLLVNGGTTVAGILLSGSANPGVPVLTFVQGRASANNAPSSLAYTTNVTISNLLVAALTDDASGGFCGSTFSVSDTLGNVWSKIGSCVGGLQVWATITTSSGANTVSYSGTFGNAQLAISEFSGVSSSTDGINFASTSPGLITTTTAYDLVLTGVYSFSAGTISTSGTTIIAVQNGTGETVGIGYEIKPIAGAVTASLSVSAGTGRFASIAFKATVTTSPGNNGDWWLNTSTGVLWGPKTGGVWSISTFDLLPTAGESKTNCSSSASPAVCGAASSGSVAVPAAATSLVVNTTAVTASSQIFLMYDSSIGSKIAVTCNATIPALYGVTSKTTGASFTITATAPVTSPACFSYLIVN